MVAPNRIMKEKASLPVDVCLSKTFLLKLPAVLSNCIMGLFWAAAVSFLREIKKRRFSARQREVVLFALLSPYFNKCLGK